MAAAHHSMISSGGLARTGGKVGLVSVPQSPWLRMPGAIKGVRPGFTMEFQMCKERRNAHVVAASGGGTGGPGNTGGKSVGEDDDEGLPVVPIIAALVVLFVAKKLYDIYVELRGNTENPKDVSPGMVLAGFWAWLVSPFSSKKDISEEPLKEKEGSEKKGYILAGSLFLVAVALLKIVVGSDDGEDSPDAKEGGEPTLADIITGAANQASTSAKA